MNRMVCKIINLSIPNLAYFAPWRESIPVFEHSRSPKTLRAPRKLSTIVIRFASRDALQSGNHAKARISPRRRLSEVQLSPPSVLRQIWPRVAAT